MAEILLVFPPQQQATDVEDLKAMLDASGDHRIQQASNLEAGMRALRHGCDLAIVGSRRVASSAAAARPRGHR